VFFKSSQVITFQRHSWLSSFHSACLHYGSGLPAASWRWTAYLAHLATRSLEFRRVLYQSDCLQNANFEFQYHKGIHRFVLIIQAVIRCP
jgi:hypothetical protein